MSKVSIRGGSKQVEVKNEVSEVSEVCDTAQRVNQNDGLDDFSI